jgi:hypothetical protein
VAAAVIALLLVAAVAYTFYRRGKTAGRKENGGTGDENGDAVAELANTAADKKLRAELDISGSEKPPVELGGKSMVEMPAGTGSPVSAASTTVAAPGGLYANYPFDTAGMQVALHPQPNVAELGSEPHRYGPR